MKRQLLTLLFTSVGTAAMAQFDMKDLKTLKLNKSQASDQIAVIIPGDFNNDGFMDLVIDGVAGSQSGSIAFNSRPLFILGDGSGLLRQAPSFPISHSGTSAFIGDVADYDRDGFLDYLVYDFWANGLRLYKGTTGMNWIFQQALPTGVHGNIGKFKDMDGDGDLDIVSTSSGSAALNAMHLYENKGGTFVHSSYDEAKEDRDLNSQLTIVDLNSDGLLDVFTVTAGRSMNCWVQKSDKTYTASFQNMPDGLYERYGPFINWFQDVNGDGKTDMAALSGYYWVPRITAAYGGSTTPYFGDTLDYLSDTLVNELFFKPGSKATGDIDHDGSIDIITRNISHSKSDRLMIIYDPFNLKHNLKIEFLDFPVGSARTLMLVDLNKDGYDDLVMLGAGDSLRYFHNTLAPTRIGDPAKAERPVFTLYPNPANDVLTVRLEEQQSRPSSAVIYAMDGKIVQTLNAQELQAPINIQSMAPGHYYITLYTDEGQRYTEKFVKKS